MMSQKQCLHGSMIMMRNMPILKNLIQMIVLRMMRIATDESGPAEYSYQPTTIGTLETNHVAIVSAVPGTVVRLQALLVLVQA